MMLQEANSRGNRLRNNNISHYCSTSKDEKECLIMKVKMKITGKAFESKFLFYFTRYNNI